MDQLKNMLTFVGVVEAGSFAEAARRLGLANSILTKRMQQLEEHLGTRLLQRSTRHLSVTEAGTAYYERCLEILSQINEAADAISSLTLKPSGNLRIGCATCFAASHFGKDICEFEAIYKDIVIELVHEDRAVNTLQEGYDLSIQILDFDSETVNKKLLAPVKNVLVASPSYLEKYGRPEHPTDLKAYRCVHNTYFGPKPEWVFDGPDGESRIYFDPVKLTNNVWSVKDAALFGNCIGLEPLFFVENELADGSLVALLTDYKLEEYQLVAYYPQSRHVPLKVRLFLEFLAEKYSPTPPWEKSLSNILPDDWFAPEAIAL